MITKRKYFEPFSDEEWQLIEQRAKEHDSQRTPERKQRNAELAEQYKKEMESDLDMTEEKFESCCQGGEDEMNEYYHHPTCKWFPKIEAFDQGYSRTEITPEMDEAAELHFHSSTGWVYTQKEETNAYLEFTHGARWQRYHDQKKQEKFFSLIFKGKQKLLWNALTDIPKPTGQLASETWIEAKNVSSQLNQMMDTGLLKFIRLGRFKFWSRDESKLI